MKGPGRGRATRGAKNGAAGSALFRAGPGNRSKQPGDGRPNHHSSVLIRTRIAAKARSPAWDRNQAQHQAAENLEIESDQILIRTEEKPENPLQDRDLHLGGGKPLSEPVNKTG